MTIPHNRFEVIGTIGTGATSRVDKARDSTIGRTVALKTFLHGLGSEDLQKQFIREAQIIGRLTHPYIIGLYDVGTNQDGIPYLVMEYVEGKTLETTLNAGRLPLERAAVWAADLASALARAHQCKIIHGDVKPANILITNEGQVKLGDFGIARFATQVSGSGNILGTPAYLSPEQIQGHKQDSRSDLFSLGIILYQMTTGVRPFDGTSVGAVCAQIISAEPPPPSYHNPELPPEFDHVVMRCLAKNPANRYATAEALGASLYPFARSKPLDELPELRSWWKRPMQTSDLRAAAGVLLALAVLGIGARAVVHHRSSQSAAHMDAKPGVIVQLPETASANDAAPANSVAMSSSASLINVGSADVSSPEQPSEFSNLTDRSDAQPGTQSPSGVIASHAFERHPIATVKSKPLHVSTGPGAAPALSSPASFSGRPTGVSSAPKPELAATAAKAPLHIDVVSTVVDETLSVYAGDELLLSTPLEAAHLGDTMRFDCPVSPGEHAFRVVLSRADESVLLEKDSTSQIRADGTNFLGVHITRRTKLLLKHETSLEVVWPSTNAPIAAGVTPRSIEALAMR